MHAEADKPSRTGGVTRLAPSPTGALHLGNARTFLVNWALARQRGWRVVLRIEDLDGPRVKPGAAAQAIDTLAWLGMDWDGGPLVQSADLSPYADALERLAKAGQVYPCRCTRSQLLAATLSAPHAGDHELRYPGTCRPEQPTPMDYSPAGGTAWRLRTPDEEIEHGDRFSGRVSANPQRVVGDFVVATKAGLPSYQLAVVLDDARQGVTEVVRGDDLLPSTPRQILLQRRLGIDPPNYTHLPIVVGEDGRRLAKRHGDTRIDAYRHAGVAAERVIGLIAFWSGITPERGPLDAAAFAARFDLDRLPRNPTVFTAKDDLWLRSP